MSDVAQTARKNVLRVANRVGAVHFGGIFSLIDFLVAYYQHYSDNAFPTRVHNDISDLMMSKGHCYLAQLAVLDAINMNDDLCDLYLEKGTSYFGHPKRIENSIYFQVSSGSLGQGLAMTQGVALANKLQRLNKKTWCIIGDGELNEGVCQEALIFASQHQLNVVVVLDNNKQQSLDLTSNILDNGVLKDRVSSLEMDYYEVDGHCHTTLQKTIAEICTHRGPVFLDLNTIKGKGVSFMERVTKWHSTRLRNNEFKEAWNELSN